MKANEQREETQQWIDTNSRYQAGDPGSAASQESDQTLITCLYTRCLNILRLLRRSAQRICVPDLRASLIREEHEVLYLWGENLGGGKLDNALEQSDDLRADVLGLLVQIGKSALQLLHLPLIESQTARAARAQVLDLESLLDQAKQILSRDEKLSGHDDQDSDEEEDDNTNASPEAIIHSAHEDIAFATQCLNDLGPCLEQNIEFVESRHDASPAPVIFSVSDPARIYVSHVREKHPKASETLVERLGEASWQRHVRVRKRMEEGEDSYEINLFTNGDNEPVTAVFRPAPTFHDSGIGTSAPPQSQYAKSHTSFRSSNTEGGRGSLRVPATPVEVGLTKPFECYICRTPVKLKNRIEWKMHVFEDLQPYICTYSDCIHQMSQFPTREAWAEHEFSVHRINCHRYCPSCNIVCSSIAEVQTHMKEKHDHSRTFDQNMAELMAYQTHSRPAEKEECPFCKLVLGKPRRAFIRHVSRHMEEIALLALPRDMDDDSDRASCSTDHELPECDTLGSVQGMPGTSSHIAEAQIPTAPPITHAKVRSAAFPRTDSDHYTDQLSPDGAEYIPRMSDERGDQKISPTGEPLGGRQFKMRTFCLQDRGAKRFMLATECARALVYRDSYLLFSKNRSLYRIIATQTEKEELIKQEIIPYSYRTRQIAFVTARSIFRQFGARAIEGGRRVRDDYWEAKAIKLGFTEEDMAGGRLPLLEAGRAEVLNEKTSDSVGSAPTIVKHGQDQVQKDVEDVTIKCICGYQTENGYMIYCDRCNTWQHTACYNLDKNGKPPTRKKKKSPNYFCMDCKPRNIWNDTNGPAGHAEDMKKLTLDINQEDLQENFDFEAFLNDTSDPGSVFEEDIEAR